MEYLIEAILRIIGWPYDACKQTEENSRIGISEMDRDAARFWRRIAITFTALLLLAVLAAFIAAASFFR